jgi:hypothetical protein
MENSTQRKRPFLSQNTEAPFTFERFYLIYLKAIFFQTPFRNIRVLYFYFKIETEFYFLGICYILQWKQFNVIKLILNHLIIFNINLMNVFNLFTYCSLFPKVASTVILDKNCSLILLDFFLYDVEIKVI